MTPRRARTPASARAPASSTGLRPKRSESGPQASWPAARPTKYVVSVSCAARDLGAERAREHRQRGHEKVGAERRQRDQHAEQHSETGGSFLLIQVRIRILNAGHARQLAQFAVQPLGVPPRARADPERRHRQRSARAMPRDCRRRRTIGRCERSTRFLRETDTDGMAILHRGKLVFERYANGMTRRDAAHPDVGVEVDARPAGRTSSASTPSGRSTDVLPELRAHRLPRRDDAPPARHARRHRLGRGLPRDLRPDRRVPQGDRLEPARPASRLRTCIRSTRTLKEADRPHGGRFHYISPNSDLLGWVIERATGRALRRPDERAGLEAGRRRAQRLHHRRSPRRAALRRRHVRHAARPRARRACG